jgi:NAD(P)H-hydrate epimerase
VPFFYLVKKRKIMKILSADNTREADAYTIKNEPIKSINLMERAANTFVSIFENYVPSSSPVNIFCGTGNNGGDGLAVARILTEKGYQVHVFIINPKKSEGSEDFEINLQRIKKKLSPIILEKADDFPEIKDNSTIIDAIFGSGLARPVTGVFAEIIEKMNRHASQKISIDIASGLFANRPVKNGMVFRPNLTITFQMPKLAFMIPENENYVGRFEIADIGLDIQFIDRLASTNHYVDRSVLTGKLKPRKKFSHKGNYGRAAIISGSLGKMGAAVLCARSCLRAGAGLVTMHVPKCGYDIIQTGAPEAMTTLDTEYNLISGIPDLGKMDAIGIGPGIGMDPLTKNMLEKLLETAHKPLVMDADAINLLGKHKELLDKIPPKSILTPHIVEFERMAGKCENHFERLSRQKEFSKKFGVIVILKGAYSAISLPDENTYFNSSGNPGMASGGSGDVLTGIITAFMAKNYQPEDAAVLATYLHGLAGDLASEKLGEESMIASDIIDFLPMAINQSVQSDSGK